MILKKTIILGVCINVMYFVMRACETRVRVTSATVGGGPVARQSPTDQGVRHGTIIQQSKVVY